MSTHPLTPCAVRGATSVLLALACGVASLSASAADDPLGDLIRQKTHAAPSAQGAQGGQPPAPPNVGSGAPVLGQPLAPLNGAANAAGTAAKNAPAAAEAGALKPLEAGSLGGALGAAAGALGAGALGGGAGASAGGGMGGLADAALQQLGLPNLGASSMANAAGVLEYCARNNLLGRMNVDNVRQGLLAAAGISPTEPPERDARYSSGLGGLLAGSDGQTLNFTMIQANLKEKACDYVLQNAASLL